MRGGALLIGRWSRSGLAMVVCATLLGASHATSAVAESTVIEIGGSADEVPVEAIVPPADAVVRLKAPPTGPDHAASTARRTEAARQMVAEVSATANNAREIEVPYAGGPLPREALDAPPGTVVKLRFVSAITGAAASRAAASRATAASPGIVVEYSGGPLAREAISPPSGAVVGLRVPSVPADDEARASVSGSTAAPGAEPVMDIPYAGGGLPPEALDPPGGAVIRLMAP